jgi:hypothetical protein
VERLSFGKSGRYGFEEGLDIHDDVTETFGSIVKLGLFDEPQPLSLLVPVLRERWFEDRRDGGDRCPSVLKCFFNRFGQRFTVEMRQITPLGTRVATVTRSGLPSGELSARRYTPRLSTSSIPESRMA